MARVYGRPRYINQARNRIISLSVASKRTKLKHDLTQVLGLDPLLLKTAMEDYELMAELALEGEDCQDDFTEVDGQLRDYLLDAEIGRQIDTYALQSEVAATKILTDLIKVAKDKAPNRVLFDEDALFYLCGTAMSDRIFMPEDPASRAARKTATDFIRHQLAPQKISPAQFSEAFAKTPMFQAPVPRFNNATKWANWAESLQYRAQPMWVKYCRIWAAEPRRLKPRVKEMVDKVEAAEAAERHNFDPGNGIECKCYNYGGILFVYMNDVLCVLDNSSCDYLRTSMTAYRNATLAFSMLRVSGDSSPFNYTTEFNKSVEWISRHLLAQGKARYVARHMHLVYTYWQNVVGESEAPVECGWEDRCEPLMKEVKEVYPNNTTWWDLVKSFNMPERVRAEFLKLYHMIPPPDIDPLLLHETMRERTQSANKCNSAKLTEFINFCMAYDIARFITKRKKVPAFRSLDGEAIEGTSWVKRCLRGHLTMPPKEKWGRIQIYKEFEYNHTGDFHVLSAKDATRVVADLNKYVDRSMSRELTKPDQNELLSALFNGEKLSNGETMKEWRAKVVAGKLTQKDVCIAAEAGKAENTKPGKKVRETLSGCDTVREYLTEVDHSIRPLAELTPGVSIRVNMVKQSRLCADVAFKFRKGGLAELEDVEGWTENVDLFKIGDRTVAQLCKEVTDHYHGEQAYEAMADILKAMGCPGFRSRGTSEDLEHMVQSFAGTIDALSGRVREFVRVYDRLRHRSPEEYSSVHIDELSEGKSLITIGKILKAQWVAAAGRRDAKTAQSAKGGADMKRYTASNYESAYLRCAARSLSLRAKMDYSVFWKNCIRQSYESLKNHIESKEEGKGEEFEENVDESGLGLDEGVGSYEQAEVQITELGKIASGYVKDVDADAMVKALKQVNEWVGKDVKGRHTAEPAAKDKRTWAPSGQDGAKEHHVPSAAPEPDVVQKSVPEVQEIKIGEAMTMGDSDSDEEDMSEFPEKYIYWVLSDPEGKAMLSKRVGSSNIHKIYSTLTDSERKYRSLIDDIRVLYPPEDCPEDIVSPFHEVRFGGDSDDDGWAGVAE